MTQHIKRIIMRRKRASCKTRRTNSDSDCERYRILTMLMKQKLKMAHTVHITTNIFESDNPKQIKKRANATSGPWETTELASRPKRQQMEE